LRTKQLRTGLTQLGEEGAIQVFRPHMAGGMMLLGAVGQLQFEVVAHRLKTEYGVEARLSSSRFNMARWVTAKDPKDMKKFIETNAGNIAYDVVEAIAFLATSPAQLRVAQELNPGIEFHALREHGGHVFGDAV
jgi:peptide chain release factor 3